MKVAEQRLRDYPNYDKEIKYRKWDLEHSELDINAGIRAQYKNTNPQEALVIAWEKDPYIQNRLFWKNCVEEMLEELEETQRSIVSEYYFENVYGYRDLGKKYFMSASSVYRICRQTCELLSEKLGERLPS